MPWRLLDEQDPEGKPDDYLLEELMVINEKLSLYDVPAWAWFEQELTEQTDYYMNQMLSLRDPDEMRLARERYKLARHLLDRQQKLLDERARLQLQYEELTNERN